MVNKRENCPPLWNFLSTESGRQTDNVVLGGCHVDLEGLGKGREPFRQRIMVQKLWARNWFREAWRQGWGGQGSSGVLQGLELLAWVRIVLSILRTVRSSQRVWNRSIPRPELPFYAILLLYRDLCRRGGMDAYRLVLLGPRVASSLAYTCVCHSGTVQALV